MKFVIRCKGQFFAGVNPRGDIYTPSMSAACQMGKSVAQKLLSNRRRFPGGQLVEVRS
jgi:hypothetical protein